MLPPEAAPPLYRELVRIAAHADWAKTEAEASARFISYPCWVTRYTASRTQVSAEVYKQSPPPLLRKLGSDIPLWPGDSYAQPQHHPHRNLAPS